MIPRDIRDFFAVAKAFGKKRLSFKQGSFSPRRPSIDINPAAAHYDEAGIWVQSTQRRREGLGRGGIPEYGGNCNGTA